MKTTHAQVKQAFEGLRKALEEAGKKDVTIIYSYRGERDGGGDDAIYTSWVSENFMHVVAACEVVKHDLLSGEGSN